MSNEVIKIWTVSTILNTIVKEDNNFLNKLAAENIGKQDFLQ